MLFLSIPTCWGIDNIATFLSDRTIYSTDLNQDSAYPFIWPYDNIDTTIFQHDVTNYSHEIYVKADGNYLIAFSMPVTTTSKSRESVRVEVRLNGVVVPHIRGESGYIRNYNDHKESSIQFTSLLPNLHVNDKLEIYVQRGGDIGPVTTSGAKLYLEKLSVNSDLFFATATQTTNSTNLNQSNSYGMAWEQKISSTTFGHDNSSNPNVVTFNSAGDYLVFFNTPLYANFDCSVDANQRTSVQAHIKINGIELTGAVASQGYIRCYKANDYYHQAASIHWFALLKNINSGDQLSIDLIGETNRTDSTYPVIIPTSREASLLIQHIDTTTKTISLRATELMSGTNWNEATGSDIRWSQTDIIDTNVFTHSTDNEITVNEDGDYLVIYSHAHSSSVVRASVNVRIKVNNSVKEGGECNTGYIRNNNSHTQSSCSLTFLLERLRAGDKITFNSAQAAAAGDVSIIGEARVTIIKKGDTPSTFDINNIPNKILHLDASILTSIIDGSGRNATDLSFNLADVQYWKDISNSANIHDTYQDNATNRPDFNRENQQITFDGSDDFLRIADNDDMNTKNITPEKTIAIVFRTSDDINTTQLIYEEGGTVRGMNAYISGGNLYIAMWNVRDDGDGEQPFTYASTPIEANTNYYATLVIDYSNYTGPDGPDGELRGHINGVKFTQLGTTTSRLFSHPGDIGVGAKVNDTYYHTGTSSGTGDYFKGDIFELIVYNEAIDDKLAVDFYDYFKQKWPDPYPVRDLRLDSQYSASSSQTPNIVWDASNTPDVDYYEMAIGISPTDTSIVDWTNIGNITNYIMNNLTLAECSNYYAQVRTIDSSGEISTPTATDWFKYDGTPPSIPSNLTISEAASSTTSKKLTWSGATDNCSFSHYLLAIGTTTGASDVVDWTNISNTTSYQFTNITLNDNTDYFFSIKAVDSAGNESAIVSSEAWQVDSCVASDTTAPSTPTNLTISGNASSSTSMQLSWQAANDSCGLSHYEIAIGTTAGGTDIVNWTAIGNILTYKFFNISPSLQTNTDYYFSLRAVDLAGNISPITNSTAWQLTPPGDVDPTGLELWLDASDLSTLYSDTACTTAINNTGEALHCWKDKSGQDNHATSNTSPLFQDNQFNAHPIIRFDGVDDTIDFNSSIDNIRTVFIVNRSAASTWQQLLGHSVTQDFYTSDNTLLGSLANSNLKNGAWRVDLNDISDPENFNQTGLYSLISVVTTGNVSADHIASDQKTTDHFFQGDIAEVIIYSRALDAAEISQVEDYLYQKWFNATPAEVTDLTLTNPYTTQSDITPLVTWTHSTSSDIDHYEVALGSTPGDNDIAGWINIGLVTEYQFNSLNLIECQDYYFSIKSVDHDGYESAIQTTPVMRFDQTPPSALNGLTISGTASGTTSKVLTWASGSDNCSSVSYQIALGSSNSDGDIINWTKTDETTFQFSNIDPPLAATTDYYLLVKAVDEAGNESTISSSAAWQIDDCVASDTTPPTAPSTLLLSDIAKLTQTRTLSWNASSESCGMSHYEVSLGTSAGATDVIGWTNIGNITNYQFSNISPYLQYDQDYYINVRGVDLNGNISTTASSSAFRLTTPGGVSAAALTLWIDTSDSSTLFQNSDCTTLVNGENQNVGCIRDLSGLDHHATSSNSSEQPTFRATSFNGKPALYFDGSANEFIDFGQLTDIRTVFWVIREDSSNPGTLPFLLGDPNGSSADFFAGSETIFDSANASTNVLNGNLQLNGGLIDGTTTARPTIPSVISLVTTGNVTASAFSRDRISVAGDRTWGGELAELIIYNQALSASEISAIENELKTKWGISSNETIWNGSAGDGDWFNSTNWSNGIPNNQIDCVINDNSTIAIIAGSNTASCRNVTISTGKLHIEPGSTLEIWGDLTIDSSGELTSTTSSYDFNLIFKDSGTETGNNSITINSGSPSNLGDISFIKTAGDTISFAGGFTANSIDIPAANNFTLEFNSGININLLTNFTQSSAKTIIHNSSTITLLNNGSINIANGIFEIDGVADIYPQDMSTKVKISASSGVWGFTATGGTLILQGFWFDHIDINGLNLQNSSDISSFNGGQFTYLQADYTTPVSAITLNTTTQLSLNIAYDIGFYWEDANNDNNDTSTAPTVSDNYYLVKATNCGGGNIYFDSWHGDFYPGDPSFDTEAKILDSDDDSNNNCQISIDIAASPVEITQFNALFKTNHVALSWNTTNEYQNRGFNIYRRSSNDTFTKINSTIIPSLVTDTTHNFSYDFIDPSAQKDQHYYYLLEAISRQGESTFYGPIDIITNGDSIPSDGDIHLPLPPSGLPPELIHPPHINYPFNSKLITPFTTPGNLVIKFSSPGFYKLMAKQLTKQYPIKDLHIYYHNQEISLDIFDLNKNSYFDHEDYIAFYLPYNTTTFDQFDYAIFSNKQYFTHPPKRITVFKNTPAQQQYTTIKTTEKELLLSKNNFIPFDMPIGTNQDHFFWKRLVAPTISNTTNYIDLFIDLPLIAKNLADQATIILKLKGHPSNTSNPTHHLKITINDIYEDNILFDQQTPNSYSLTVPLSILYQTNNKITLTVMGDYVQPNDFDVIDLDSITIRYPQLTHATNDYIHLVDIPANSQVDIHDFSHTNVLIYDKIAKNKFIRYKNYQTTEENNHFIISFDSTAHSLHEFWILTPQQLKTDYTLERLKTTNKQLKNRENRSTYLIIAPEHLLKASWPLANYRMAQGEEVFLTSIEQIYREFSFLQQDPYAIRNFIRYTKNNWQIAPLYILFIGDATYDYKNHLNLTANLQRQIPMPLYPGLLNDFGSPDWFATLPSEYKPFASIGWLPTNSTTLLQNYIQKVITYEQQPSAKSLAFITGREQRNENFNQHTDNLIKQIEPNLFSIDTFNSTTNTSPTELHSAIINAFKYPHQFITYFGHGAENMWDGQRIFTNKDAQNLRNTYWPVVIAFNCLNGYFFDPDPSIMSLAETLIFNPQGGAIAFWGSTAMSAPLAQQKLGENLFSQLDRDKIKLGELLLNAKQLPANDFMTQKSIRSWVLFGDPALELNIPNE